MPLPSVFLFLLIRSNQHQVILSLVMLSLSRMMKTSKKCSKARQWEKETLFQSKKDNEKVNSFLVKTCFLWESHVWPLQVHRNHCSCSIVLAHDFLRDKKQEEAIMNKQWSRRTRGKQEREWEGRKSYDKTSTLRISKANVTNDSMKKEDKRICRGRKCLKRKNQVKETERTL